MDNCHFVCRIRKNTKKTILEQHPLQKNSHIFFDANVLLGTPYINQTQEPLRLVGYVVEGKEYWAATDRFDLSAEQISLIYKLRGILKVSLHGGNVTSKFTICSLEAKMV